MIITKRERFYKESRRKWFKHGKFDKEMTYQTVKRTTIMFFFILICWWEKITDSDLL